MKSDSHREPREVGMTASPQWVFLPALKVSVEPNSADTLGFWWHQENKPQLWWTSLNPAPATDSLLRSHSHHTCINKQTSVHLLNSKKSLFSESQRMFLRLLTVSLTHNGCSSRSPSSGRGCASRGESSHSGIGRPRGARCPNTIGWLRRSRGPPMNSPAEELHHILKVSKVLNLV